MTVADKLKVKDKFVPIIK